MDGDAGVRVVNTEPEAVNPFEESDFEHDYAIYRRNKRMRADEEARQERLRELRAREEAEDADA